MSSEIAELQKGAQAQMRCCEREPKAALAGVLEYGIPEGRELTPQDDVEAWMRLEFSITAHTAPKNPHLYFAKKKGRRSNMYERAVAYILEHGHRQDYGGDAYAVLHVEPNGTRWFT